MAVATSYNSAPIPIFNQRWPNECPKALSFDLNFNVGSGGSDIQEIDLTIITAQNKIEGVQACYYNNVNNLAPVALEAEGTGFTTLFRAQYLGYRTLLVPQQPKLILTCSGGTGIMQLILTNTPIMPMDMDGS